MMLYKIEIKQNDTPEFVATEFLTAWHEHKVFHLSGLGVTDSDNLRAYFDAFMEAAGTPSEVGEDATGANRDAQRTGQRWTEIRYDPDIENAYRHSANPQPLHTDGSYDPDFPEAAIIYCQHSAAHGGETIFLDYDDLISSMEVEVPQLLEALTRTMLPHSRSGFRKDCKAIDRDENGGLLSWNYYCVDQTLPQDAMNLRQQFHEYLSGSDKIQSALLPVPLKAGEGVIWKDHRVLHGRNGFNPKFRSERFLWKSAFSIEKMAA